MTTMIKLKETKLLVDYGVVFDWGVAAAAAEVEVEKAIAVVIDNETMNEDPDEKTNVNSNLTKTDERGCSTGDANTRVQAHVFVSDMQMND
jgi:hypothetical protein